VYCATYVHHWVGCEVLSEKVVGFGCEVVGCGWVEGVLLCGVEGGGHWSGGSGVQMPVVVRQTC